MYAAPFAIDSIAKEIQWERSPFVDIDTAALAALIRLWAPDSRVTRCELIARGGRNTNYRIAIEGQRTEFVMRIYAFELDAWRKEQALHRLLADAVPSPCVVYSGFEPSVFPQPVTVFEYIEGESLRDGLVAGRAPATSLLRRLGGSLAHIHAHPYDRTGSLDENLRVVDDLPPFEDWIDLFLNARARARLGADVVTRYQAYVRDSGSELARIASWTTLVHGDFRPTNVLVRGDDLVAVIDWEFSFADHPFSDLGQMIRHGWMSSAMEEGFVKAYNEVSASPLPGDWKKLARLRDSINLLQLIGGKNDRPRMYEDLRRLILSVIE
jgi:aminoglycoside phosphotransferase (APT) family kinase protein